MKNKLTEQDIKDIKKLRSEGKTTYFISDIYHVAQSTIVYHLKRVKIEKPYKDRKEYLRMYFRNRYQTDEKFREKQKERARIIKRKNYKKKNE